MKNKYNCENKLDVPRARKRICVTGCRGRFFYCCALVINVFARQYIFINSQEHFGRGNSQICVSQDVNQDINQDVNQEVGMAGGTVEEGYRMVDMMLF